MDKTGIELGASRILVFVVSAAHLGAIAIVLLLPLDWSWRVPIILLVSLNGYHVLVRHALRVARTAVVAFAMDEEGNGCRWRQRGSVDWITGRVVDRWVHAPLTLLVLRQPKAWWPVSVVIVRDAVASEPFRRLRVRLKLQTAEA